MIAAVQRLLIVCALVFPLSGTAKPFKNSFLQFELPDNWTCVLANTEWICNPSGRAESREAVLVVAAKAAGPEDNFEEFQKNLKRPRTLQGRLGTPVQSQVLQMKDSKISGQRWMDALHLGSEIEGFYTRYLVTVKERLSILISLTCQKTEFTKYSGVFSAIVPTLKIIASPETLKSPLPQIRNVETAQIPTLTPPASLPPEPEAGRSKPWLFYVLVFLSGLILVLFIVTVRSDKKRSQKRRK